MMELVVKDISKLFDKKIVLDNVNILIKEGEFCLFIGENGSGKSTLMKIIGNVLAISNKEGGLYNSFDRISYLPDKYMLPQSIKSFDYLCEYTEINDKKNIKNYMKKYGIVNKRIHSLSKGMLQKVCIISVLLKQSDLYLFDEPLDGLDKDNKRNFKEDINKLLENGKTVIIITHNRMFYKGMNAIVYKFENGRVIKNE